MIALCEQSCAAAHSGSHVTRLVGARRRSLAPQPMKTLALGLASALLAGAWEREPLLERARRTFGRRPPWLPGLINRLLADWPLNPPTSSQLVLAIQNDAGFLKAVYRGDKLGIVWSPRPAMAPAAGAPATWRLPSVTTAGELAAWLGVTHGELTWFAGGQGGDRQCRKVSSRHYRYAWIPKRHGEMRLLESPKSRLKALQSRVLRGILDLVPPHEAAHGFRAGCSIRSFALPHVGRRHVLRMDLKDFFPRIHRALVEAVFLAAGYPEAVSRLLAGLCTNTAPADLWDDALEAIQGRRGWPSQSLYGRPHLPQGAPTSPALANLCAFRLDCRLSALARATGAVYTRYADDLAFSGEDDFGRAARRFQIQVGAIAIEEGLMVNTHKTRVMRAGVRQQLAGVVVNRHANVARGVFDRLKAILHNCVRHGPEGQNHERHENFRAHLAGRIAHVVMLNPERGKKLRTVFERISW